jgi:hypothetical protein
VEGSGVDFFTNDAQQTDCTTIFLYSWAYPGPADILTVWVSPEDPAGRGVESAAGSRTSTACFLHVKRASNPSVESTTCFLHVKRASNSGRYPSHQKGGVNSSTSGGVGCGSEWRGAANSSGFDRIPVRVGRGSQEHVRKNKFAQVSKLVYDCAADHKQVITNLTSYPTSTFIQTSLRGSLLRRASGRTGSGSIRLLFSGVSPCALFTTTCTSGETQCDRLRVR